MRRRTCTAAAPSVTLQVYTIAGAVRRRYGTCAMRSAATLRDQQGEKRCREDTCEILRRRLRPGTLWAIVHRWRPRELLIFSQGAQGDREGEKSEKAEKFGGRATAVKLPARLVSHRLCGVGAYACLVRLVNHGQGDREVGGFAP